MRIAILTKRREGFTASLAEFARRRGHLVSLLDLETLIIDDGLGQFDLVVQKSKQLYLLYAGFHAQALGVRVVPDPGISHRICTRIERPFLAAEAGLATPRFYFASPDVARRELDDAAFPLVRKGIVGSGSLGVEVIASKQALPRTRDRHWYLEELIPGRHIAVHFIEDEIRAYEKRPFASGREPVKAMALPDDVASAVRQWQHTTGLRFGHLDFVRDARTDGLVMVDAGPFPQFRHWPGAVERIGALLLGCGG